MKIIKTPRKIKQNIYTVTVEFEHGDCDASTYEVFDLNTEEELIRVCDVLHKLKAEETVSEDQYPFDIPRDVIYNGERARYNRCEIVYYDANGNAHDVEIK